MVLKGHVLDGSDGLQRSILKIQQDMTSKLFMRTTTLLAQSIGHSFDCESAFRLQLFAEYPLLQY